MSWTPHGLIVRPDPSIWWMSTFAGPAYPVVVEPGHVRLFITGRDDQNISRIGPVDIDWSGNRPKIMGVGDPVVDIGQPGLFDSDGAAYPWITHANGKLYLYYVGWLKGHRVAMHHGIGVAVSDGWDKPFVKASRAPILPLTDSEPFGSASCCVDYQGSDADGNGKWRMFYTSFIDWRMEQSPGVATPDAAPRHYYSIRETHSRDGITWSDKTRPAIDHLDASEYALGKPCLTHEDGKEVLYFVARGERYRIWRATRPMSVSPVEPHGATTWVRDREPVNIPVAGWDSNMQAYPVVWNHRGEDILFYNGNGYGRTGLGWAKRAKKQAAAA